MFSLLNHSNFQKIKRNPLRAIAAVSYIFKNTVFAKDNACVVWGYIGHQITHFKNKQKNKKTKFKTEVNVFLSKNVINYGEKRKYVNTKINGQNVKLLLDSGCDISIKNEQMGTKYVALHWKILK